MDGNYSGFLIAILPVALSPGASFTLAINSALAGGMRGLFNTLCGTALGIYSHALLIGLGISTLLLASPAWFGALKIAGCIWLLWLGVQLVRSAWQPAAAMMPSGKTISCKEAWLANVLNPKAVMFYLTVVPQFAGKAGKLSVYLTLASLHILVMALWLLTISALLIWSARRVNLQKLKRTINTLGGAVLIFFALFSLHS
ncbi:LysE family translocator [Duffyella gerundensis]|uniref:LysE family translocator n=1 Tax=Duffyella gerundensis TaxID=1619313 RepID=UPI003FD2C08D